MMGIMSSRMGRASVMMVLDLNPMSEMAEIMNPRNRDPQSPMKMLAG